MLLVVLVASPLFGGELAALRQAARAPSASDSPPAREKEKEKRKKSKPTKASFFPTSESDYTDDCDDSDEDDSDLNTMMAGMVGQLIVWGASTPFTIPRAMIGDESFQAGYPLRYPYLHDHEAALVDGFYTIDGAKKFMLRARGEHIDDFESLSSTGGGLFFDSASRWGLDSQFHYRREDTQSRADELWTGDTNLLFRFAQSEQLQMRAGVGFNWLADAAGSEFGFNAAYGGDWFPIKPLIISHEIDWGKLGSATLFHGRVTAGVNYHRLETYIGYDYYDVGPADLAGMVAGVRLWLAR